MHKNTQNRFRAKISWAAFAVTALMLSACTVGPNYHRPVVQTPTSFHGADESQQAAQTESFADLPWWQVFHDSQLQELIRTALKQNYDLQLAVERVNAARSQVGIVRSNQFPQLSLDPLLAAARPNRTSNPTFFRSPPMSSFKWIYLDGIGVPLRRLALNCWAPRTRSRP
jgi:outer membrane protein, multidrug efflux system